MKKITSKENPTIKLAAKLSRRKYREETGLYILEGRKPIEDAMAQGIPIRSILVREGVPAGSLAEDKRTLMLDENAFRALADTQHSQGVAAIAEQRRYDIDDLTFLLKGGAGNVIVLDRLQDPGNIGTIIRTAEAAGYAAVIVMPGCGDVYSPKVVRAAAGSLFRMPVVYARTCTDTAEALYACGMKLVVSCLDNAEDYDETDWNCNTALVIGNEGQGVSEEFMHLADMRVRIPMAGAIESLNAAVAAGILMYQLRKTK